MRLAEGELLRFIACCSRGCKILSNFAAKPRNRSCGPSHFLGGYGRKSFEEFGKA